MPEGLLTYDMSTRSLTYRVGSRKDAAAADHKPAVLAYVHDNPGCTRAAMERDVTGDNTAIRAAVVALVDGGLVSDPNAGRAGVAHPLTLTQNGAIAAAKVADLADLAAVR